MANLQESILQAVDTLVQNRIEGIEADKTVIATIVACSNALTREYKVNYNGGYIVAYAQEGVTYSANTAVYVLVPQGDFTQKKTIIGKTQAVDDDQNISFVSSALSNYNLIGANCISDKTKATPAGLNSYLAADYALLYKYGDLEHKSQFISIDEDMLNNNLLEAEAVMVEASFMTRLPRLHRYSSVGKYGLEFVLAFKDTSKDLISAVDIDYLTGLGVSAIDVEIISFIQQSIELFESDWLNDGFISQDFATWKTRNTNILNNVSTKYSGVSSVDEINYGVKIIGLLAHAISNKLDSANSLNAIGYDCADLVLKYIYTPDSRNYTEEELSVCAIAPIKYLSYVIDSNSMTGNPYNFASYAEQYGIFPIDKDNFLRIDSILFYSQDFVEKDDQINADLYGDDIFVKELEFYGLQKITAQNGDYVLSLSMPQGNTFKSVLSSDTLKVVAKVAQNINTNLSDTTTFYWLKRDSRIGSDKAFAYAGKGWKLLDVGNSYSCKIAASDNLAFENRYLCIAIYHEELILKQEFVFYNDSVKRELAISSSLGVKFNFDRGIPELTCSVDGKTEDFDDTHPDDYFRFVWSKTATDGTITIFDETKEELEARYKENLGKISYSELSSIKNQIQRLEGVSWDKNKLVYPVKQINSQETFTCSVYLRDEEPTDDVSIEDLEYLIGAPDITLINEQAAEAADYYIEITNGDQVFQYSESGISPNSSRYENPQTVMPLSCKFYDPNNVEVSSAAYNVKWKVPLSNSMITVPTVNMVSNPANSKIEWCLSQNYPLGIAENYNYNYTSNQVQCIVEYEGQTYTRYTNLLFTKVGENGTNGTDIVARIVVDKDNLPDDTLPSIVIRNGIVEGWNTGEDINNQVFKFKLYQRNEELEHNTVNWAMAGGRAKYFGVSSGVLSYTANSNGCFRTQIVKASTSWESTTYYAYYGFPVIHYNYGIDGNPLALYDVFVSDSDTIKSILYNANGYNPLYNKTQGVCIKLMEGQVELKDRYIVWQAEGGMPSVTNGIYNDNPIIPDFKLIAKQNSKDGQRRIASDELEDNIVYILPNDFYSGEYVNNLVHIQVYSSKNIADAGGTPEVEIYVPINMSLNTYELQSLNAWDGTHLEINEDENYILAPQIGAGEKDKENKFTGLVMGKAQYYDETDAQGNLEDSTSVGLMGYSHGLQSMFLNAEDGSATFGLPQANSQQTNSEKEGRIKLIPGGTSTIANWHIGANSIYNITTDSEKPYLNTEISDPYNDLGTDYRVSIPSEAEGVLLSSSPSYLSVKSRMFSKTTDADYTAANTIIQPYDSFELQMDPKNRSVFTLYRHTSAPEGILFTVWDNAIWLSSSLIAEKSGYTVKEGAESLSTAILNSAKDKIVGWTAINTCESKTYVIGRPMIQNDGSFDNTYWYFCAVSEPGVYMLPEYTSGDSDYENNKKIFDNLIWHREAKVGINSQGRFYTNALKDSTTALNIGPLGGFGHSALENAYVGATFEVGTGDTGNSLIKFFTPMGDVNSKTGDLYITGATDINNEYQRAFKIYGSEFEFFADDRSIADTSEQKLSLTPTNLEFGYFPDLVADEAFFKMPLRDKNGTTQLKIPNNFSLYLQNSKAIGINGGSANISLNDSKGDFIINSLNETNFTFDKDINLTSNNGLNLTTKGFHTNYEDSWIDIFSKSTRSDDKNTPLLNLRLSSNQSQKSYLNFDSGLDINTQNSGVDITSNGGAEGIHLAAIPAIGEETNGVTLSLIPQSGGANSTFKLLSPSGSIWSQPDILQDKYAAVGISGVVTDFIKVTDALPNTSIGLEVDKTISSVGGEIIAKSGHIKAENADLYGNWFCPNGTEGIYWHAVSDRVHNYDYYWNRDDFEHAFTSVKDWDGNKYRIGNLESSVTSIENSVTSINKTLSDKAGNDVWDYVWSAIGNISAIKRICSGTGYKNADALAAAINSVISNAPA